jgi:hypothetical protein
MNCGRRLEDGLAKIPTPQLLDHLLQTKIPTSSAARRSPYFQTCQKAAQATPLSCTEIGWYCWSDYLAGEYENARRQTEECCVSGRTDPITGVVEALASLQLEEPDAQIERLEMRTESSLPNDVPCGALG